MGGRAPCSVSDRGGRGAETGPRGMGPSGGDRPFRIGAGPPTPLTTCWRKGGVELGGARFCSTGIGPMWNMGAAWLGSKGGFDDSSAWTGSEPSIGVRGKQMDDPEDMLPAEDCSFLRAGGGRPSPGTNAGGVPGLPETRVRGKGNPFVSGGGGGATPFSGRWPSKTSDSEGRCRCSDSR
jgi:hypothetical protein